jgi:hypothetical protein
MPRGIRDESKPCPQCGERGHDGRKHGQQARQDAKPDLGLVELLGRGRGHVRSKTLSPARRTKDEKAGTTELVVYPDDVDRPLTRGDCEDGQRRPCPFVTCSMHLYLDVNPTTGAIKLNFPHLEVWEMPQTCALDVANHGGITLDEVGTLLNLTRERVRQMEEHGLRMIKRNGDAGLGVPHESPESAGTGWRQARNGAV